MPKPIRKRTARLVVTQQQQALIASANNIFMAPLTRIAALNGSQTNDTLTAFAAVTSPLKARISFIELGITPIPVTEKVAVYFAELSLR